MCRRTNISVYVCVYIYMLCICVYTHRRMQRYLSATIWVCICPFAVFVHVLLLHRLINASICSCISLSVSTHLSIYLEANYLWTYLSTTQLCRWACASKPLREIDRVRDMGTVLWHKPTVSDVSNSGSFGVDPDVSYSTPSAELLDIRQTLNLKP